MSNSTVQGRCVTRVLPGTMYRVPVPSIMIHQQLQERTGIKTSFGTHEPTERQILFFYFEIQLALGLQEYGILSQNIPRLEEFELFFPE